MRVLCVHHKGGVGKTTTAVHVAGALAASGKPVLLIDGDTQDDSFRFFNDGLPPTPGAPGPVLVAPLGITVASVDGLGADLRGLLRDAPGHVVLDAQPDRAHIGQLLAEAAPDLVLLCVKKDDVLGFMHLGSMFATLRALWDAGGVRPRVVILSTGAAVDAFAEYIPDGAVPHETPPPLPYEPALAGEALLTGTFLWDLLGGEAFYNRYLGLLTPSPSP